MLWLDSWLLYHNLYDINSTPADGPVIQLQNVSASRVYNSYTFSYTHGAECANVTISAGKEKETRTGATYIVRANNVLYTGINK